MHTLFRTLNQAYIKRGSLHTRAVKNRLSGRVIADKYSTSPTVRGNPCLHVGRRSVSGRLFTVISLIFLKRAGTELNRSVIIRCGQATCLPARLPTALCIATNRVIRENRLSLRATPLQLNIIHAGRVVRVTYAKLIRCYIVYLNESWAIAEWYCVTRHFVLRASPTATQVDAFETALHQSFV